MAAYNLLLHRRQPITILPCSRQREAVESGSLAAERADRDGPIIHVHIYITTTSYNDSY